MKAFNGWTAGMLEETAVKFTGGYAVTPMTGEGIVVRKGRSFLCADSTGTASISMVQLSIDSAISRVSCQTAFVAYSKIKIADAIPWSRGRACPQRRSGDVVVRTILLEIR